MVQLRRQVNHQVLRRSDSLDEPLWLCTYILCAYFSLCSGLTVKEM